MYVIEGTREGRKTMALSASQKEKLKALEVERGGVAFATTRSQVKPNPTIVISLGGLGGKTLNILKGKFEKEIGSSDHVYFRMIDTCENDMNSLCTTNADGTPNNSTVANVERVETIALYNTAMANILFDPVPAEITRWLNPQLKGTTIDNTGAQQIRQIGRVMMTAAYENVRTKLQAVILDAIGKKGGDNVDVIILAGISGGTGSGTIIDLTYMIHDIFASNHCDDYRIAGYIYTPDVQFRVPDIARNQMIQSNLKRNGYAALKEIDYFMNLVETRSVYRFQANAAREVVSNKNIFHNCVLISGYSANGGLNDPSDTMGRLTDQLLDMLTDIQVIEGGVPKQMSNSIMSNERAVTGTWFNFNQDRRRYHRYASYKYQVLGYSSIRIPRDEILAYCVNKIYEGVLNQFTDMHLVNKQMVANVYKTANIINASTLTNHAVRINPQNPINREVQVGPYTKRDIQSDNNVAFNDARQEARREALKMNAALMTALENDLVKSLKDQVDNIFSQYGPYVALKAITHKQTDLEDGDSTEPFPGICEWLDILKNQFITLSNNAKQRYANGGSAAIAAAAETAKGGIFTNHGAINEYVATCCEEAVAMEIDAVLYQRIAQVLENVNARMGAYNNEIFDVYTSILTEVQKILSKDGQYFSQGNMQQDGNHRTYSIDLIRDGQADMKKLQAYLDDFISHVSVEALANNFTRAMTANKEKWLALQNENNFDPVSEVRTLIDECLTENSMTTNIIEKFVTVAYSPRSLTAAELDAMWDDDTPSGPKMQALSMAANNIYNLLDQDAQPMAHPSGNVPLTTFSPLTFISTLNDTPMLSGILKNIVTAHAGFKPADSNSSDRFIFTQQYTSLPMYILAGMKDANDVYCHSDSVGKHMDEREQNWGRFQNPYTIDAVALDLAAAARPAQDIEQYRDYAILMKVKKLAKDGLEKYRFIENGVDANGAPMMTLMDIVTRPANMDQFKENLSEALRNAPDLDIIDFMRNNGFVINPVNVEKGVTDVDLQLLDFANAIPEDMNTKYNNVPVPVEDVYKWLRKSTKYMDILEKDTAIFEELYKTMEKVKEEAAARKAYIDHVKTFAFALRTKLVENDEMNKNVWRYMDGMNPVTVNFALEGTFNKKYCLYQLFTKFVAMNPVNIERIYKKAEQMILNGQEDPEAISFIKESMKSILTELDDPFLMDVINEQAKDEGVLEAYMLTDQPADQKNPYRVVKRFYTLLQKNM